MNDMRMFYPLNHELTAYEWGHFRDILRESREYEGD
jgi:hypothetical protein